MSTVDVTALTHSQKRQRNFWQRLIGPLLAPVEACLDWARGRAARADSPLTSPAPPLPRIRTSARERTQNSAILNWLVETLDWQPDSSSCSSPDHEITSELNNDKACPNSPDVGCPQPITYEGAMNHY